MIDGLWQAQLMQLTLSSPGASSELPLCPSHCCRLSVDRIAWVNGNWSLRKFYIGCGGTQTGSCLSETQFSLFLISFFLTCVHFLFSSYNSLGFSLWHEDDFLLSSIRSFTFIIIKPWHLKRWGMPSHYLRCQESSTTEFESYGTGCSFEELCKSWLPGKMSRDLVRSGTLKAAVQTQTGTENPTSDLRLVGVL